MCRSSCAALLPCSLPLPLPLPSPFAMFVRSAARLVGWSRLRLYVSLSHLHLGCSTCQAERRPVSTVSLALRRKAYAFRRMSCSPSSLIQKQLAALSRVQNNSCRVRVRFVSPSSGWLSSATALLCCCCCVAAVAVLLLLLLLTFCAFVPRVHGASFN